MMEAIGFLLIYGLYVSIVMLLEHRHGKPLQPCDVLQHDVQHVVQDVHKQQYDEGMPLLHRKNSAPTPRARAFSMVLNIIAKSLFINMCVETICGEIHVAG